MGDKNSWNRNTTVNQHNVNTGPKPIGFDPRKVQSSVKANGIKLDSRQILFSKTPPSPPNKRNNK
ncbi:hypothetical protein ABEU80_00965 [Bacillus velezensis]|uniref:hypothetical protein n=1 Tax=Bacillus siamensis TaxID=659243 RepID=UPI0003648A26|nr:hypothetical protein [Bacillus siamensis]